MEVSFIVLVVEILLLTEKLLDLEQGVLEPADEGRGNG